MSAGRAAGAAAVGAGGTPAGQPGYLTITVPVELLAAYVGLFRAVESSAGAAALRAACAAVRQAGG